MAGEIIMTITLGTSDGTHIQNVTNHLTRENYFCIGYTRVNDNKRLDLFPNFIISCSKIIQEDEISRLHEVGNELTMLNIGITRIITRKYSKDPTLIPKTNKIKRNMPHTLVILIVIIAIIVSINFAHPNILSIWESIASIIFPVLSDIAYTLVHK